MRPRDARFLKRVAQREARLRRRARRSVDASGRDVHCGRGRNASAVHIASAGGALGIERACSTCVTITDGPTLCAVLRAVAFDARTRARLTHACRWKPRALCGIGAADAYVEVQIAVRGSGGASRELARLRRAEVVDARKAIVAFADVGRPHGCAVVGAGAAEVFVLLRAGSKQQRERDHSRRMSRDAHWARESHSTAGAKANLRWRMAGCRKMMQVRGSVLAEVISRSRRPPGAIGGAWLS